MHLIHTALMTFFRVITTMFGLGLIGSAVALIVNLPSDWRAFFGG